jgi:hypothetical protein
MVDSSSQPTTLLDPSANSATAGSSDFGFDIVPQLASVLKLEVPVLPCYVIPLARNKDFFGRQEIFDRITEEFRAAESADDEAPDHSRSFALCGQGGIGKTQIATEYAYRCKDTKAFDAIFLIGADDEAKLTEGLAQIATSLKLVEAGSPEALDPIITTNLTKEWLSNPGRSAKIAENNPSIHPRWLMILDNVDDPDVLRPFLPIEGPGCVLITSRDPLAKEPTVLADSGCDVECFDPRESSDMLQQLTKRTGDGGAIGQRLGGLPLTIVQMASIIIRNHMSFEEFVETWDERQEHPEYVGPETGLTAPDTYDKTNATMWAIDSLQHGRPLLEIMAFLHPDNIQESIIKQYSFDFVPNYPTKLGDYLKARRELLQTSLIRKNADEQNFSVHRIVQDATRSTMSKSYYQRIFTAALYHLCSTWPFEEFGWRHGVARWKTCEELFPHVTRMKIYGSTIIDDLESTEIRISYCKLMNDAGW